jgi:5-methylcytosine-specific restriction protein A
LGTLVAAFPEVEIDLRPSSPQNDSAFYEAGNICAKFYAADALPSAEELGADYRRVLELYDVLSYGEASGVPGSDEDEGACGPHLEDLRRFRFHKRVERNAKLARAVKRVHGYTCQACGFNFADTYGSIGENFIEAHHLTPLSSLHGQALLLDPRTDFAVLCANCHRMIHRTDAPHDLATFTSTHVKRA